MTESNPISRRKFLEKTALAASVASVVGGATKARAQLNNGVKPPAKRLGAAFIGVGIRGTQHLEAAREISGIDLVAVCDLYSGHLDRAIELTGKKMATTKDYQEVLARSDVDAVIIAVPDHWHKKVLFDALQAGKHAYIEKPMTIRWEDGAEFVEAVKKSKKVVQVGSQYLSMGINDQAKEFIRSGRLGQITLIEGKIHRNSSTGAWYYPIPPDASPSTIDWKKFIGDTTWHEFDPKRFFQWRLFWEYSGGLATDLYVHLISATHYLTGASMPEKVVAFGDIYRWKNYREVPDQLCAMANYPEGFCLKLTCTSNNSHPGPALTFYGTEGTLEYDGDSMVFHYEPRRENYNYPCHSWTNATIKQFAEIMNLKEDLTPISQKNEKTEPLQFTSQPEGSTTAHQRNFFDAIRGDAQLIEPVEFGANAVTVGHMANISFRTGKIVQWNAKKKAVEV